MSDTRALLERIAAFRERLAQPLQLVPEFEADPEAALAHRLAEQPGAIPYALRLLVPDTSPELPPPQLTLRARRILEDTRALVAVERQLSEDPWLNDQAAGEPVAEYHRETVALTESALRLVQTFPPSAEEQLRLCEGLEAVVQSVRDRLAILKAAVHHQRRDQARLDGLARRLGDLAQGRAVDLGWFVELAEQLLEDAKQAAPLDFLPLPTRDAARFVAAHALTVAQVVARVVPHDYEWAGRPVTPVLAALLMDLGLVGLPVELLAQDGPWTPGQRRLYEAHPQAGADRLRHLFPDSELVAQVIAAHHERPDGTGFPNGAGADAIPTLARLLSACDFYATRATDRPHRAAVDPRTALMDTLFAAEEGKLDRDFAELLLHLAFYPVGTVVELTDGRVGQVVANHPNRANPRTTTRPVVAVVVDRAGLVLPRPEHVDLAASERGSVARVLPRAERRALLGRHYPEWCR